MNYIKKRAFALMALVAACSLLLGACAAAPEETEAEILSEREELLFATGSSAGTYYAYATALSQVLGEAAGESIRVRSTSGSADNIIQLASGDMDIGLAQNDIVYYAVNGLESFSGGAVEGVSAIATCYIEVCQIVAEGGVDSIEELEGLVVSVGESGSGVETNARQILEAYGMDMGSISPVNLSFSASAKALQDGEIDAFFCTAGAPTSAISALVESFDVNLLEIDEAHAAVLAASYPFYTAYTIPAESYAGISYDVPSVAVKATLIVSNGLSEDRVYALTKALFENAAALSEAHPKGAELSVRFALEGIAAPLHPGAAKYYNEVGAL
ncbi:MAG: TAXI family TRAP transporter solute-binding subunit [Oscillospiraceae bacterium]|nr:TAXI family TRAP transporter solute-binding subunit [Oscillospiraceae bacterium]